jgi:hypothetical protein
MSFASFNPSTFTAGGLSEGEVTIKLLEFGERESEQYGSSVVLTVTYEDDDGQEYQKFYNVGKSKFVQASNDGKSVESVDESREYRFSLKSGAGKFFIALQDAGFPMARLDKGDISVLEGTRVIVETKASGTTKLDGSAGSILLPTKIVSLPGGGKPVVKSASPSKPNASTPAPSAPPAVTDGAGASASTDESEPGDAEAAIRDKAIKVVTAILIGKSAPVAIKDLQAEIFTELRKDADKAAIMRLAADANFLTENWNYDARKKVVSVS